MIEATIKTYPCGTIREKSQSADMYSPVFSAPLPVRPGQYRKIISRSTSSACHSGTGLTGTGLALDWHYWVHNSVPKEFTPDV
ncbi:hypothetical protein BTUL_0042g00510 [Botrytis tulipae]|uniref:Uncharacterized protein n=1 Tax=Botrytis tulipae TaxID=87230 RepID=A0A4Z1EUZ7_9HELO|nr:hypothetical protein BTUL_0042g00510 [Botrytis tulipae]